MSGVILRPLRHMRSSFCLAGTEVGKGHHLTTHSCESTAVVKSLGTAAYCTFVNFDIRAFYLCVVFKAKTEFYFFG